MKIEKKNGISKWRNGIINEMKSSVYYILPENTIYCQARSLGQGYVQVKISSKFLIQGNFRLIQFSWEHWHWWDLNLQLWAL